jgi:carbon storage regulator
VEQHARQDGQQNAGNLERRQGMLVLTRKNLESIQIGDGIRITVVKVEHGRVRLGIDAPDDVLIVRQELVGAARNSVGNASAPPATAGRA